jgi:hypothetical protein
MVAPLWGARKLPAEAQEGSDGARNSVVFLVDRDAAVLFLAARPGVSVVIVAVRVVDRSDPHSERWPPHPGRRPAGSLPARAVRLPPPPSPAARPIRYRRSQSKTSCRLSARWAHAATSTRKTKPATSTEAAGFSHYTRPCDFLRGISASNIAPEAASNTAGIPMKNTANSQDSMSQLPPP